MILRADNIEEYLEKFNCKDNEGDNENLNAINILLKHKSAIDKTDKRLEDVLECLIRKIDTTAYETHKDKHKVTLKYVVQVRMRLIRERKMELSYTEQMKKTNDNLITQLDDVYRYLSDIASKLDKD